MVTSKTSLTNFWLSLLASTSSHSMLTSGNCFEAMFQTWPGDFFSWKAIQQKGVYVFILFHSPDPAQTTVPSTVALAWSKKATWSRNQGKSGKSGLSKWKKKLRTNEINHFITINMNIFLFFVLERKHFLFVLYLTFLFLLSFTVHLPNFSCQNLLLFLIKCRGSKAMQCFSPKMQHLVSSKQKHNIVMQNFFFPTLLGQAHPQKNSIQLFTCLPK